MKQILSSVLALIILVTSFQPMAMANSVRSTPIPMDRDFDVVKDCPNGQCADTLIGLIQSKTKLAQKDGCLPPKGTKDLEAWFESRTMSIQCFKLNREIDELIQKLEKVESHYRLSLPENGGQCCNQDNRNTLGLDLENLSEIDKANAEAMCTEDRKKQIWKKCGDDAMCVFISTATGIIPSNFVKKMLPENLQKQGCDPSKDDCMKQLALAFVKSVFSLFEGAWELLKMAGRGIKSGVKSMWSWVVGAEDQSSTAQLAAAGASEEEGVFRMLMNDFPGTMAKLWTGLIAAIKHWLANNMFCQEWSGRPQFSECKRPATGLDCLECKTMLTGMCSLTGAIVAEIIPAFLAGGLLTCAKHGANAAAKVAKLFKVSEATTKAIKSSKVATMVSSKVTAVTTAVRASQIGSAVLTGVRASVTAIGKFMVSPAFKVAKLSVSAMVRAASRSKTFLMLSPAGPALSFGSKALVNTGKVIIYPIENPMTIRAFQIGEKAFEKVFMTAGKSKVMSGARPALAGEAARGMAAIDDAYTEVQVMNYLKPGTKMSQEAEIKYLAALKANRATTASAYLEAKPTIAWNKLVDDLYPELNYGKLKNVKEADVIKAENDLLDLIGNMSNKTERDRLMEAYQKHTSSLSRNQVVKSSQNFNRESVIANSLLDDEARVKKAFEVAGVDASKLSKEAQEKMSKAILEAHNAGDGFIYNYSYSDITQKVRKLREAGFNTTQTDSLIRSGLAGKSRAEDAFPALRLVVVDEMKPQTLQKMMTSEHYAPVLKKLPVDRQPAAARALKIIEDGGASPAEAAAIYIKYEPKFVQVQGMVDSRSDAAAYLAEYIKRERKAGLSDDVIMRKLDDAFKDCK